MPKTANEIFQTKVDHILGSLDKLGDSVRKHQTALYQLLIAEFLPLLEVEDGIIKDSVHNLSLIGSIDTYFDQLYDSLNDDVLSGFANNLVKSAQLSAEYYVGLGFKKTVVDGITKNKITVEDRIGIDSKGNLKKDGYLFRLGKTTQARDTLKNYVLSSLTGDTDFLSFQLGFRNLVLGNKKVKGVATTGELERYFDQYAYDTFNQVDAATNRQFAAGLDLNHFIYEGSLIDTSRKFCKKRAGKAFTVKETKKWKDDPDLIDKKTKEAYNPLIDRGRYRCRHFIKYITEELYKKLIAAA